MWLFPYPEMTAKPAIESRLQGALADNHEIAARIDRPGFPREEFEILQAFQRQRLARSYADLEAREEYRPAVVFFLEELYGGLHFRERDRQVARVLPVMVRMLPAHMLNSLAGAFELQALSLDLDGRLAEAMCARSLTELTVADYAAIYPAVPRSEREAQLEMIRELGLVLTRLVDRRGVMLLIRAMRAPARAAGFGALQDFLERGLGAFRAMDQHGAEFIATVFERESAVMQRLYAGDGDPFRV